MFVYKKIVRMKEAEEKCRREEKMGKKAESQEIMNEIQKVNKVLYLISLVAHYSIAFLPALKNKKSGLC